MCLLDRSILQLLAIGWCIYEYLRKIWGFSLQNTQGGEHIVMHSDCKISALSGLVYCKRVM